MAESGDSLEFHARYNGWNVSKILDSSASSNPKNVAAYLASVREEVAERAFQVLGIDTNALNAYAEKLAKSAKKGDYSSLVGVYKSLTASEAETDKAAQNKEELKPFAKAYLFRATIKQLGLDWYVPKDSKFLAGAVMQKSAQSQFQTDCIYFMAKYKDWVAIKKLSIGKETKPEEVAAQLSSIRLATDRKIPQVLGVDTESLDVYASAVTENMRKSAANLEKITNEMCSEKTKEQINEALTEGAPREAAIIYLFGRMLQNIRIDLEVSPETLMDMFPGLKIPKPKGRMPGQKKKKQ